ncbi:MAG: glycyl-radical enzyme activating protein [Candidatus Hodarchaeales archaeon]
MQKMSTEDGPGIRTTVFFKECPLRCAWCHNPESFSSKPSIQWFTTKCIGCKTCIEICPNNALSFDEEGLNINRDICQACGSCVDACPTIALRKLGEYWSIDELVEEVAKDLSYYIKSGGGVTASGGEAAIQSEFVTEFFKRCKELGFHTALDTCGILPKKRYLPLLRYTDLILYDIKEIDPEKHRKFTGVSNERILQNIKWLIEKTLEFPSLKIWIRTPIIPKYTGTEDNIRRIGEFIVNELHNKIERWDLLAYNNLAKDKYERMDLSYLCEGLELYTKEEMEEFYRIAQSTGANNVQWSGLTKSVVNVQNKAGQSQSKVKLC